MLKRGIHHRSIALGSSHASVVGRIRLHGQHSIIIHAKSALSTSKPFTSLSLLLPRSLLPAPPASGPENKCPCESCKPGLGPVLVVPGFLNDHRDYVKMVEDLREKGFYAAAAPLESKNWACCVGGRNTRPILDRMDHAIQVLLAMYDRNDPLPPASEPVGSLPYSNSDWFTEMLDASKGACHEGQRLDKARCEPYRGTSRAAIVAHSAAGWISRIFLGGSDAVPYGNPGRIYEGHRYVHTLVTLGSPHTSTEGIAARNIGFVNKHFPGAHVPSVRYVLVAGDAVAGKTYLWGTIQDLAYQSYVLCIGRGDARGDGIVPVECALALPDAPNVEKLLLRGARHSPMDERGGSAWYGSVGTMEKWWEYLEMPHYHDHGEEGEGRGELRSGGGQQQLEVPAA